MLTSDGGEDVEARKTELRLQLERAQAAVNEAKSAHDAMSKERTALAHEKRKLGNDKTLCQQFLHKPKNLAADMGSLQRQREEKVRLLPRLEVRLAWAGSLTSRHPNPSLAARYASWRKNTARARARSGARSLRRRWEST